MGLIKIKLWKKDWEAVSGLRMGKAHLIELVVLIVNFGFNRRSKSSSRA